MIMRPVAWHFAALATLSWVAAACGDLAPEGEETPDRRKVTTHDRSGVAIVEIPAAALPDSPVQPPLPLPILRFDGGDEPIFRVSSAFGLSDGTVAIADRGSQSVRVLGLSGRQLRRLGGPGEGPGEFRDVTAAGVLAPDSIWVFDALASRLTVFGPGDEVRTERLEATYPYRTAFGVLARSLLLAESPTVMAGSEEGLRRDSVRLVLSSLTGQAPNSLGRFPGNEVLVEIDARPGATRVTKTEMPFAYGTHHAVVGDRVVTAATERYELVFRDADGTIRRIVRADLAGRLLDADLRRAYAEARVAEENMPDRVPQLLRRLEAMPLHERGPAIRTFVAGGPAARPDEIWVGLPPSPRDSTASWIRHDSIGIPTESVELPADLRLTDVTNEYFVGVRSDDLGVERVELYRR